jgi:putative transposase
VGTGLGVLRSLLEADVDRLVGRGAGTIPAVPRYATAPSPARPPWRSRPRVRRADGAGELLLSTWQAFAATDLLDQLILERMLAKLSTRRYAAGLEPVGAQVEQAASGTSKSAVSRRFVAATARVAWPGCSPRTCPSWTWSR